MTRPTRYKKARRNPTDPPRKRVVVEARRVKGAEFPIHNHMLDGRAEARVKTNATGYLPGDECPMCGGPHRESKHMFIVYAMLGHFYKQNQGAA